MGGGDIAVEKKVKVQEMRPLSTSLPPGSIAPQVLSLHPLCRPEPSCGFRPTLRRAPVPFGIWVTPVPRAESNVHCCGNLPTMCAENHEQTTAWLVHVGVPFQPGDSGAFFFFCVGCKFGWENRHNEKEANCTWTLTGRCCTDTLLVPLSGRQRGWWAVRHWRQYWTPCAPGDIYIHKFVTVKHAQAATFLSWKVFRSWNFGRRCAGVHLLCDWFNFSRQTPERQHAPAQINPRRSPLTHNMATKRLGFLHDPQNDNVYLLYGEPRDARILKQ